MYPRSLPCLPDTVGLTPHTPVIAVVCAAQERALQGSLSNARLLGCILVIPLCCYYCWCFFVQAENGGMA